MGSLQPLAQRMMTVVIGLSTGSIQEQFTRSTARHRKAYYYYYYHYYYHYYYYYYYYYFFIVVLRVGRGSTILAF